MQRDGFTDEPISTDEEVTLHTHKKSAENGSTQTLLLIMGKAHSDVFGETSSYLGDNADLIFIISYLCSFLEP